MNPPSCFRPELLAPAGGFDAACAALQYGADAVYLGLPRFSARADAQNLSPEQLADMVRYAHRMTPARKVYCTLNTLVRDAELPDALDTLSVLDECGVDAVIIQDWGVFRLARRFFPRLRLHASTQLAAHNLEGARALAALGFRRVVLARELGLVEISEIARHGGIEVEVFVHGALCYSYSGLCLFSSHQTGRSGNRGRCAYICRETFRAVGAEEAFAFSMRDLAMIEHLEALRAAGVTSLKIEGRMKSPLYVACVTDFYRRQLDGTLTAEQARALAEDVQTIFSRPWTHLHAEGTAAPEKVIDPVGMGHRGALIGAVKAVARDRSGTAWLRFVTRRALEKHDGLQIDLPGGGRPYGFAVLNMRVAGGGPTVFELPAGAHVEVELPVGAPPLPAGSPVYCSSSQAVIRRYPVHAPRSSLCRPARPLAVTVELFPERLCAHGAAGDLLEAVELAQSLEPARQPAQTPAAVRRAFERMGDSRWALETLEVRDPHGLYAPLSALNALRRMLVERMDASDDRRRAAARAERLAGLGAPPIAVPAGDVVWNLKTRVEYACSGFDAAHEIVLAMGHLVPDVFEAHWERWRAAIPEERLRVALPLIARAADFPSLEKKARRLLEYGWRRWECADLAGLHLLKRLAPEDISVTADWSFYALNRMARAQQAALGVERAVSSPEDAFENIRAWGAWPHPTAEVLIFQHTPLFIAAGRPCVDRRSGERMQMENRRGQALETFLLDGQWITLRRGPFCVAHYLERLQAAGIRYMRVDFSWAPENLFDGAALWRDLRAGRTPRDGHEANFTRGFT